MSEHDFTLSSGAPLHISSASFDDCGALIRALAKCAKGLQVGDDVLATDLSVMKDYIVEALASAEFERALFKCMERASYRNQRVTKALFDDPTVGDQAREDYYEMAIKVVEVNAKPFFVKAFSVLKERLANVPASQRSPLQPTRP